MLVDQYEWRGPRLGKILTRVCIRTCLDLPNEQLRTIRIGPDGIGPKDASPTFYSQQNQGGVPGVDGIELLRLMPLTDGEPTVIVDDSGVIITDDSGVEITP